jgi:hypothetical protein
VQYYPEQVPPRLLLRNRLSQQQAQQQQDEEEEVGREGSWEALRLPSTRRQHCP